MLRPLKTMLRAAAVAVLALAGAGQAHAGLVGSTVTGSLTSVSTGSANLFDPIYGGVPAGDLNAAGTTVVISPSAVEFGLSASGYSAYADFTATTLTIGAAGGSGVGAGVFSFTDSALAGFTLTKLSDSFGAGGLTGGLSGNTISLGFSGAASAFNYTATYALAPASVPEPAAIALLGAGLLGLVAIRRRPA